MPWSSNFLEPIIIVGMARSGTSMVAGVFKAHGLWGGTSLRAPTTKYPKGFNEHQKIKGLLLKNFGRADIHNKPFDFRPDWAKQVYSVLRGERYDEERWFVKHSALYARAWEEFRPLWILVRRSEKGILASLERRGQMIERSKDWWKEHIRQHVDEMDRLELEAGGVSIFADELIKGIFWSAERALLHCGLDYDRDKVKEVIRPEVWGLNA